jgi:hypothetical protein
MYTILAQWKSFEEDVIPDVHPTQRQEMRRAFYSGINALMKVHDEIAKSTMSVRDGIKIIEGWEEEMKQFIRDLEQGKA